MVDATPSSSRVRWVPSVWVVQLVSLLVTLKIVQVLPVPLIVMRSHSLEWCYQWTH